MFAQITCASCGTMGQFSVLEGNYKGPYRCWKCKALYTVEIQNGKVVSSQPMAESELEDIKARQEAQKKGIPYIQPAQTTQQVTPGAASAPKPPPFAWPQPPATPPQPASPSPSPSTLPKAPFNWPQPPANPPKPASAPPSMPKAPFVWPPIPKSPDVKPKQ